MDDRSAIAADGEGAAELRACGVERTPEDGIDPVAVTGRAGSVSIIGPAPLAGAACAADFADPSCLSAGLARGSGMSPEGGDAQASPARMPTAAMASMSRMAVTGTHPFRRSAVRRRFRSLSSARKIEEVLTRVRTAIGEFHGKTGAPRLCESRTIVLQSNTSNPWAAVSSAETGYDDIKGL
jgi:hypothetical protein